MSCDCIPYMCVLSCNCVLCLSVSLYGIIDAVVCAGQIINVRKYDYIPAYSVASSDLW